MYFELKSLPYAPFTSFPKCEDLLSAALDKSIALLTAALTSWSPFGIHQDGGTGTCEGIASGCGEDPIYDSDYLEKLDQQCDYISPYGLMDSYGCKCMFTVTTPPPDWDDCESDYACSSMESEEYFRRPSWFHSREEDTFEMDWTALLEEGAAAGEDVPFGLFSEIQSFEESKNSVVDNEIPLHDLDWKHLKCEDCCRKEMQEINPTRLPFGRQVYWESIRTIDPNELLCAQKHVAQLCYV